MVVPMAPSMMAMRSWNNFLSGCSDMGWFLVVSAQRCSPGWRAILGRAGGGLVRNGEEHLQVRFLRFTAGDVGRRDLEPGPRQELPHLIAGEAGVPLPVARGDLVLLVAIEAK